MNLATIDITIIIGYFLFITLVGLLVSKKAAASTEDYFLGGRAIPWYLLGISGMATFIDIGGTSVNSAFYYVLGAKGFWVSLEGAVALLLSFQMIYVAKWLNRSGAITNAEWMVFRFGKGPQGEFARIICAVGTLILCVAMMTYFFEGAGKALVTFLPFSGGDDPATMALNENLAALGFFTLVGLYTIAAGFYGVIYTDLIQAFLIILLIIYIAVKAMMIGTPEYFAQYAPPGWLDLIPKDGNWSIQIPEQYRDISVYVDKAGFLGVFVIFWLLKELLMGFATPFDSWTAQRYYAARNEKEASLVACQWISLWSFRFLLMAGIGVLALGVAGNIDHPERALSIVIADYLPVGIQGMMLAGLLAAGMSTIDSFANSSGAYFVKDIYKEYLHKDASDKRLVRVGYLVTFVLMGSACVIGWKVENISSIWGWIMMGLFVGTLPPNIMKWFWWRANGMSYAVGTAGGLLAALSTSLPVLSELKDFHTFVYVVISATVCSVIGTYAGKPTDMDTLVNFYRKTRPFGFWKPVRERLDHAEQESIQKESSRDRRLLPVALFWHLSLFLMMSSIIFKDWLIVTVCAVIVSITSFILYKFWYMNMLNADEASDTLIPCAVTE
jgi:solute:Na+ symporter, SSS family